MAEVFVPPHVALDMLKLGAELRLPLFDIAGNAFTVALVSDGVDVGARIASMAFPDINDAVTAALDDFRIAKAERLKAEGYQPIDLGGEG